jgi:hypothetical protein
VNVVSTELGSTPLIVATRPFSDGPTPLLGDSGNELSLFLSLVTGFLETIPVPTRAMLEPEPSTPSNTAGAALTTKARSKDLARNLEQETKNPKKEESPALPPSAPTPQELVAFLAKPAGALDFPASLPALAGGSNQLPKNENSNGGGSVQRTDIAPNLPAPAPTAPAVALGDLAFALRLTPNRSEILNALQAVVPATPLNGTNSASGLNPPLAQTSTAGLEKSISNQAQVLIAIPAASATTAAQGEPTSEHRPVSSPALSPKNTENLVSSSVITPKNTENANAPPWLQSTEASTKNFAIAPCPELRLNSGSQFNSEPQLKSEQQLEIDSSDVPADGLEDDPDPAYRLEGAQTHNALPDVHRSLPPLTRAGESEESQPVSIGSKAGPAVKQEFPDSRPTDGRFEGRVNAAPLSAWPSDVAGAPDTPASSPSVEEPPAPIAPSEPEIKPGVAPSITRQISLNLSTDDSTQVHIGLSERAGQVLVAVRTPDHELAQSLQTNLGDLIGRLDGKGIKTESWIPAVARQDAALPQSSNSNTSFNQPQSGPWYGSGQQRQGQNSSNRRQKARWATQLQETISTDEARSQVK